MLPYTYHTFPRFPFCPFIYHVTCSSFGYGSALDLYGSRTTRTPLLRLRFGCAFYVCTRLPPVCYTVLYVAGYTRRLPRVCSLHAAPHVLPFRGLRFARTRTRSRFWVYAHYGYVHHCHTLTLQFTARLWFLHVRVYLQYATRSPTFLLVTYTYHHCGCRTPPVTFCRRNLPHAPLRLCLRFCRFWLCLVWFTAVVRGYFGLCGYAPHTCRGSPYRVTAVMRLVQFLRFLLVLTGFWFWFSWFCTVLVTVRSVHSSGCVRAHLYVHLRIYAHVRICHRYHGCYLHHCRCGCVCACVHAYFCFAPHVCRRICAYALLVCLLLVYLPAVRHRYAAVWFAFLLVYWFGLHARFVVAALRRTVLRFCGYFLLPVCSYYTVLPFCWLTALPRS